MLPIKLPPPAFGFATVAAAAAAAATVAVGISLCFILLCSYLAMARSVRRCLLLRICLLLLSLLLH